MINYIKVNRLFLGSGRVLSNGRVENLSFTLDPNKAQAVEDHELPVMMAEIQRMLGGGAEDVLIHSIESAGTQWHASKERCNALAQIKPTESETFPRVYKMPRSLGPCTRAEGPAGAEEAKGVEELLDEEAIGPADPADAEGRLLEAELAPVEKNKPPFKMNPVFKPLPEPSKSEGEEKSGRRTRVVCKNPVKLNIEWLTGYMRRRGISNTELAQLFGFTGKRVYYGSKIIKGQIKVNRDQCAALIKKHPWAAINLIVEDSEG